MSHWQSTSGSTKHAPHKSKMNALTTLQNRASDLSTQVVPRMPQDFFGTNSPISVSLSLDLSSIKTVTTMSNSGPYPVTLVASQLYSSTPVAHHLLRSRSRRYTSVKYDPWSSPYSVHTTPHRLPCLDVSSPCTCYIHHLVSFSPDLVYFTRT